MPLEWAGVGVQILGRKVRTGAQSPCHGQDDLGTKGARAPVQSPAPPPLASIQSTVPVVCIPPGLPQGPLQNMGLTAEPASNCSASPSSVAAGRCSNSQHSQERVPTQFHLPVPDTHFPLQTLWLLSVPWKVHGGLQTLFCAFCLFAPDTHLVHHQSPQMFAE